MSNLELIEQLSKLKSNSTFLCLNKYKNAHGGISNYCLAFNFSYENAVRKSKALVEIYSPESHLETKAKEEILISFEKTLSHPLEDIEDCFYMRFHNDDGTKIKGIKLHLETGILHLYGMQVYNRVIVPGEYKVVNSKPLTIAKKKIMSLTPVSKFRQFKILPGQVESISVQNLTLIPKE